MIRIIENEIISNDMQFEKGGLIRCKESDFIVLDMFEDNTQHLVSLEDGYIIKIDSNNRTFNDCIDNGILNIEHDFEIKSGYYPPKDINIDIKIG